MMSTPLSSSTSSTSMTSSLALSLSSTSSAYQSPISNDSGTGKLACKRLRYSASSEDSGLISASDTTNTSSIPSPDHFDDCQVRRFSFLHIFLLSNLKTAATRAKYRKMSTLIITANSSSRQHVLRCIRSQIRTVFRSPQTSLRDRPSITLTTIQDPCRLCKPRHSR
jgi:hypothetical protein